MEYLMTYGWAILVVMIVGIVMWQLGIFNMGGTTLTSTGFAKIKPQLVLLSAGFDADRRDPVGGLGLQTEDFALLTRAVLDVADAYAEGKLVSTLEGGYELGALAESVIAHVSLLTDYRADKQ